MKNTVLSHLPASYPWQGNLSYLESVDSTNTRLKEMASAGAPHGTVIIADSQTGGRGRMGRSFHSPAGSGIYLSMLLRPKCAASQLMHLTCAAAVAAAEGIAAVTDLHPGIKWTNDLVFDRKKLGGILTELSLDSRGNAEYAVVGIGINCTQEAGDFPEEIRQIATSLQLCTGKSVDRAALIAGILVALHRMWENLHDPASILTKYRQLCITVGQDISLVQGDSIRHGRALDVDESGALVVKFSDGQIQAVNSGEISIRGMYGYT